ncbi:MAG: hypothetical protein KDA81_23270, partial [Planctomycetaceae bacterium]|nr:hypothetical protein [Planctomycetaceae bacterium]
TRLPTIRKPLDVLTEGLLIPENGGSRTPVELFAGGVVMLDLDVRRQIEVFSVTLANGFPANQ